MKQLLGFILVFALLTNISSAVLSPPTLLLPVWQKNKVSTSQVEFFWTSVDSATKYILVLSDDYYFKTKPILLAETLDTFLLADVKLDSAKTYFWRVTAINDKDTSKPSYANVFTTTFPRIITPAIISPKHDTIHQRTARLEWEFDKNATSAFLQYADDSLFMYNSEKINLHNNGFMDFYQSIMKGSKYYWRVLVSNPDTTTDWSDTGWFKFDLWNGPEFLYPNEGDTNVSIQPKLFWHSIDSAVNYNLFLFDNDTAEREIFKTVLIDTSFKFSLTLEYEKYYTLKLFSKVKNASTINTIVKFRTMAPPVPFTKSIMLIYPDSVKPVTNPKPAFRWNSETNADSYELWVSDTNKIEDETRLKIHIDEFNDTVYTMSTTSLRPNKDYYWRVRGINISGRGKWSDVWMFRTSNFSDVEETYGKIVYISPNPATDFIEISLGANGSSPLQSDVKIFDVFGQRVNLTPTLSILGEGVRIDVSGLSPGMYFVRIGDKVGKYVKL